MKKEIPKYFRWGVSIIFVIALIYLADPLQLLERVQSLSVQVLGLLFAMLVIQLFILCMVYWRIIRVFSIIPFRVFATKYLMGWSTEFFLPGKLGAFSIAYLLRHENVPLGVGVAMVVFVKFMTLALMLGIILLAFPTQLSGQLDVQTALIVIALALAGVAVIFFTSIGRSIIRRIVARFGADKFVGFGQAIARLWKSPRVLAKTIMGLLLSMLVGASILSMVYASFGYDVSIIQLLVILSLSLLAGAIPISLNGIGVKEGITVFMLAQLGVPVSLGLVISAVNSGIGLLAGLLVGIVLANALPKMVLQDS